jgi:hypothetical protein
VYYENICRFESPNYCRNCDKTHLPVLIVWCPSPSLSSLYRTLLLGTVVAQFMDEFIRSHNLKKKTEPHSGLVPLMEVAIADCSMCSHLTLKTAGGCAPGDVCLMAKSGRQIDRFLRRHPQFAAENLADEFWERRAIAARHAPLEALRQLPRDKDEVVRRVLASRLPIDEIDDYLHDSDREVRMTVANRITPERLLALVNDEDYLVRLQVVKRLPHGQLRRMANDEDREVRKEVARRLPPFALSLLVKDDDEEVRRIIAARMLPDDAVKLLKDQDWVVRLEAAQRAPIEFIAELVDDAEPDVQALVRQRLNEFLLGEN